MQSNVESIEGKIAELARVEMVDSLQKRVTKLDIAIKMIQTDIKPPEITKKKTERPRTPLKVLDTTPPEPPKPKVSPIAKLFATLANQ